MSLAMGLLCLCASSWKWLVSTSSAMLMDLSSCSWCRSGLFYIPFPLVHEHRIPMVELVSPVELRSDCWVVDLASVALGGS